MLHTGSLRVSLLFPLSILVAAKFLPKFIYVSLSLSLSTSVMRSRFPFGVPRRYCFAEFLEGS